MPDGRIGCVALISVDRTVRSAGVFNRGRIGDRMATGLPAIFRPMRAFDLVVPSHAGNQQYNSRGHGQRIAVLATAVGVIRICRGGSGALVAAATSSAWRFRWRST